LLRWRGARMPVAFGVLAMISGVGPPRQFALLWGMKKERPFG
jgi:hypothetical protein